jgi:hypothetical protein
MTPFELTVQSELDVEWQRFNNEWLFPWHNLNIEGRIVDVPNFQGTSRITIGGCLFQGQQQDIYWQAIGRYLNQKIHEVFRRWDTETSSYPSKLRSGSLDGVDHLLKRFVAKIVTLANDTALRLKARGYPQNVTPYNSTGYHSAANVEIIRLVEAHKSLMAHKTDDNASQPQKTAANNTPQLYFAHAFENRDIAKPLAQRMMADGIDVWFDEWEIRTGDSLRRKMEAGLANCTHFLALLTPQSLGKPWVETEIDAGFLRNVGGDARFLGIRVGIPISKLSPFLQTLRCPEIDLNDASQVESLIADIHGVSIKPPLGSVPSYATAKPNGLGRWSKAALAIAEFLVRQSERGVNHDPITTPGRVSHATGIPEEDVRNGMLDLNDAGFIEESSELNSDAFWAKPTLFAEFDGHFLDFVPKDDAVQIAHRLVNDHIREITIGELAKQFPEWLPRRLNSALSYLETARAIQPRHAIGATPYLMVSLLVTDYTVRFTRNNGRRAG